MKLIAIIALLLCSASVALAGTLNIQTPVVMNGTVTCNWIVGPYCRIAVTQPISNLILTYPADGLTYTLEFDQDTIGHFITLPANILGAASGAQPIPGNAPNNVTVWMMTYNGAKKTYLVGTSNGSGGTFTGVSTDSTLVGTGIPQNPVGINVPVDAPSGGTGASSPTANSIPVANGASPFNFVGPLGANQILQGTGPATPPVASSNYTIGIGGHLQGINNPPTVANCGTAPTVIGSDFIFQVSIGSGTVTSCQINFQNPMPGGALCLPITSRNPPPFSTTNLITYSPDPSGLGRFITLQGLSTGADIGCELVTVLCIENILP